MRDDDSGGMGEGGWLGRSWAWLASPMGTAVCAVGLSQIISWGTTLYLLGVMGQPIATETGWSRTAVFGGLTLGLIVSGVTSTWMGRLIDRVGARLVMTAGAVLAALGLVLLSLARDPYSYFAIWALLGLAMRMTLYDAAFAAMVQVTPARGRRAISYLTLFGGFASTVFWPIAYWLEGSLGWRATVVVFALINLLLVAPLNWFGLARREPAVPQPAAPSATAAKPVAVPQTVALSAAERRIAIALFMIVMSATAFVFGVVANHLPGLMTANGIALGTAVALASLKGVAQVGGRVWEIVFASHLSPLTVGRISIALMPVSFLILMASGASFTIAVIFILVLGASNGLVTIVRGAVPLHLFGTEGYGAILGLLATPYLILNAVAPTAFALIIDTMGPKAGEWVLIGFGLLAAASMEVLAAWYARRRTA